MSGAASKPSAGSTCRCSASCRRRTRRACAATVDAYLAGDAQHSRLEVFDGLGLGTTMLSTRQFEHPDAEPLEAMIADWLAARLA